MNIKCFQLDPRPVGAETNGKILSTGVLGIEVTIPALASRCDLGNLDHHGPESTDRTPSACKQALKMNWPEDWPCEWVEGRPAWPLYGMRENLMQILPVVVTIRPDADSVTAMAVLENRSFKRTNDIRLVDAVDQFDRLGPASGKPEARVTAIARKAMDFKLPLEERVQWVADLLAGADKSEEVAALIAAHDSELEMARRASELTLHADGRIVCVISTHRFATTLGYENAPVVVAMNLEMPVDFKDVSKGTYRKFTVCRYDSHVPCDLPAALVELQKLEPGWGGRGDIFGSPQGVSSSLSLEQVLKVVEKHLKEESDSRKMAVVRTGRAYQTRLWVELFKTDSTDWKKFQEEWGLEGFFPKFAFPHQREGRMGKGVCGEVKRVFLTITQVIKSPGRKAEIAASFHFFGDGDWVETLKGEYLQRVLKKLDLPSEVELSEEVVRVPESVLAFSRTVVDGPGVWDVSVGQETVLMTKSEAQKTLTDLVNEFKKVGVEVQ